MVDSEKILPQEHLDAMPAGGSRAQFMPAEAPAEAPFNVSATTMEELRARAAASPPPMPTPAPADTPPTGTPEMDSPLDTVAQLSGRLARLESAMQQTGQMQQQFQALVDQMQAVKGMVESLSNSLQNTVGFGAHQSILCRSCQSQGHVATRLHCTACGEENWWGWWPPQEH